MKRKRIALVALEERNKPYDVHYGQFWDTRVWLNRPTHTWSELRADFYCLADGSKGPSLSEEEIRDIRNGCDRALKLMRKHRVRQLWHRIFLG
ncbi:MAG: hypothetical protein U0871_15625 [Gemmataceae bacterium]